MKCPACGSDVMDGSKTCSKCGHDLSMAVRTVAETEHLAKETGAVVGKLGRGALGGMKTLAADVKKGVKRKDDEKQA